MNTTALTTTEIDVKEYEMENLSGASLYVGTYHKYNCGSIYGMWVDLEKFTDAEDFFEVCRALHADEKNPEFMFQDFQGFPYDMYHESMCEDSIQKILDYLNMDEDDKYKYEAYCKCVGTPDDPRKAIDRCIGVAESFTDWCDEQADAMLDELNVPHQIAMYFDYAAYERDLNIELYHAEASNGMTYIFDNK